MWTCEAIAERAREISSVIDRSNYRAVADAVLPPTGPIERLYEKDDDGAEYSLPEWHEYRRERPPTTDWLDVVQGVVLGRQWHAALVAHGLATRTPAPTRKGE